MRLLASLARLCAILGGSLLTAIALLTCASLIGRNTLGLSLAGDFELTGVASGAAIALFLPWCQWQRGNIAVDFFTAKASVRTTLKLDRFGALLLAGVMALLTWRTGVGALNALQSNSGTMLLDFPEWLVYASMVPPLALTALIALVQGLGAGVMHFRGNV
ncbi:MAG: TRAP transporter small permease [Rhodoferax sp.]|uniref:TRAP transporter small permease n=1 Tax=Rhodoferax sp. TaxID=50421 RepID=UPI0013FFCA16|nr:TRAP transporter small permease [Rhodoferax sp.]NDP39038.1 TRAP transporter small permease [Rhodoferax sp.]